MFSVYVQTVHCKQSIFHFPTPLDLTLATPVFLLYHEFTLNAVCESFWDVSTFNTWRLFSTYVNSLLLCECFYDFMLAKILFLLEDDIVFCLVLPSEWKKKKIEWMCVQTFLFNRIRWQDSFFVTPFNLALFIVFIITWLPVFLHWECSVKYKVCFKERYF